MKSATQILLSSLLLLSASAWAGSEKEFVELEDNYAEVTEGDVTYILETYTKSSSASYFISIERQDGQPVELQAVEAMALEYIKPRGCSKPIERRQDLDKYSDDKTLIVVAVSC